MKKHNVFLSIALLLSAATSQVSFCMQQELAPEFMSNEKRISELHKEVIRKSQKGAEKRDKKLGELSILSNEVLNNICEWLKLEDLRSLGETGITLNEITEENIQNPIKDSNKTVNFTIDLNDVSFLTKFHEKLKLIQEKMLKFIKGTNRTLTINFKPPFGIKDQRPVLNMTTNVSEGVQRYPSITINKDNIAQIKTNILDTVISRKDLAKSEAIKNKKAIMVSTAITTAITAYLIYHNITSPIDKKINEMTSQLIKKCALACGITLDKIIYLENLYKKINSYGRLLSEKTEATLTSTLIGLSFGYIAGLEIEHQKHT